MQSTCLKPLSRRQYAIGKKICDIAIRRGVFACVNCEDSTTIQCQFDGSDDKLVLLLVPLDVLMLEKLPSRCVVPVFVPRVVLPLAPLDVLPLAPCVVLPRVVLPLDVLPLVSLGVLLLVPLDVLPAA